MTKFVTTVTKTLLTALQREARILSAPKRAAVAIILRPVFGPYPSRHGHHRLSDAEAVPLTEGQRIGGVLLDDFEIGGLMNGGRKGGEEGEEGGTGEEFGDMDLGADGLSFPHTDHEARRANSGVTRNEFSRIMRLLNSRYGLKSTPKGHGISHIEALDLEVLYMKRSPRQGDPWSGHVCFPGGHQDKGETDVETAVREVREEVGLDLARGFMCVGRLDDRCVANADDVLLLSRHFFLCSCSPCRYITRGGKAVKSFVMSPIVFLQVVSCR